MKNAAFKAAILAALVFFPVVVFSVEINPPRPDELIRKADAENGKCRGGPGDDPYTPVACYERDKTISQIRELGWCWGPRGAYGYQKKWIVCSSDRGSDESKTTHASRLDPDWRPLGATMFFLRPAASNTPAMTASLKEGKVYVNFVDPRSALCGTTETSGPNDAGPYKVNDKYLKFQSLCLNGTRVFGPSSTKGKEFLLNAVESGSIKVELDSAPPLIFMRTDFESVKRELMKTESAL